LNALLLAAVSPGGWGAVYFAAPAGKDTNPGTAERSRRRLSKAASALSAGDTVIVGAGTYTERVVPARSGSPGKPITYAAAAGSSVIIDRQGITLDDDLTGLFLISGRNHLIVRGFRVINAGPHRDNAGILVDRSSDIVLSECSTADTASSGIGVWASRRVTIQGCRVERAGSGGWQESITVAGTEGFEVRSCTVRDCRKEGICLKDGSSRGTVHGNEVSGAFSVGIYVDAWDKPTRDIEVYANLVHDNAGTGIALASEMGGRLERIWIHDNVSFRNRWLGIQISTNGDSPTHPMWGITVINNTCAGNAEPTFRSASWESSFLSFILVRAVVDFQKDASVRTTARCSKIRSRRCWAARAPVRAPAPTFSSSPLDHHSADLSRVDPSESI